MVSKNLKSINNISLRFQDYDNAGTKYAFDIHYTLIHSQGEYVKAERQRGAEIFSKHIKDLIENYDDVATITVSDYGGTARNARRINPPTTIELSDNQSDGQAPQPNDRKESNSEQRKPVHDVLQGLSGLFSETEFAGFGNLAPVAKYIDDKHTIDRLHEKYDEISERFMESERKNAELSAKYRSLSDDYERLQEDTDDMAEELDDYRNREQKQNNVMSVIGLAGANIAKTFLQQNPSILSGIVPVEQLSGILSGNANTVEAAPVSELSEEEQERLDKATALFEWLQGMEKPLFDNVYAIMSVIHKQPAFAEHIVRSIKGKGNKNKE